MKSLRVRKPTTQRNRARVLVFGKYLRAHQHTKLRTATALASRLLPERRVSAWLPIKKLRRSVR